MEWTDADGCCHAGAMASPIGVDEADGGGSAHPPKRDRSKIENRKSKIPLLLVVVLLLLAGRPAHANLETALEKFIGRQAAVGLADQFGTRADPVLTEWVSRVGDRVSVVAPRQNVRYRVQIMDSDEANAIALPGGFIFVTRGLLEFVQDDDELACVIAHEVGHVSARHSMRQIKHQILASFVLTMVNDKAGNLAGSAASLADGLFALGRSRNDELAADLMGAEYAAKAGYDPAGILSFFRKIAEPRKPSWTTNLFATHPYAEKRIARAKASPFIKEPSAEILVRIGDRLAGEHRFNKALEKYRAAERLRPDDGDVARKIADALITQGRRQQAVALYLRAGRPMPPPAPETPPAPRFDPAESEPARQAVDAAGKDLSLRQKQAHELSERTYKALHKAWRRHEWSGRMQAAMLGLPQGLDHTWIYLALRCAMLSADVDGLLRGASRIARLAPTALNQAGSVCSLAGKDPGAMAWLSPPLLLGVAGEMDRAGKEALGSLDATRGAIPDIDDADRLLAAALADLNSAYVVRWPAAVAHVAIIEGLLDRGVLSVRRAEKRLSAANRDATRAAARAHRAGIDLMMASASPEEKAIFRGAVCARLGASQDRLQEVLDSGASLADAAVILLYTKNTTQPISRIQAAHDGATTWIEAAEKAGLPVDVQAIVLRLLYNTVAEERVSG